MLKHPYFAQNPNLALQTVTTIHGTTEYRTNCKKYDDGYYVKGLDLIEQLGEWVKADTKKKVFDHELQKDVPQTNRLLHGIVDFENGKEVMGHFSRNPYTNGRVYLANGFVNCMNVEKLDPKLYVERLSEGTYYKISVLDSAGLTTVTRKGLTVNNSHNSYNIEDNRDEFKRAIGLYEKSDFPIDKDIKAVARYLKGITFGMELETINGTLPAHLMAKYGIIICKDGSIKGGDGLYPPEYVTVPLSDAKGLQTMRNISQEIAKRSDIDIKCSYHLHLGNLPISRVFLVSLFRLCFKIQNDVFKMFPYYKTDPTGIKDKNYCKKLANVLSVYGKNDFNDYINNAFTDLYRFLSGGLTEEGLGNGVKARRNPFGGHKWDCKTRYFWVNFINPIFGKRDTIEFRIHTPTLNPDKIINWLLICSAIVRFAEYNTDRCIKLNKIGLAEVLGFYKDHFNDAYSRKLTESLIEYYKSRVQYFEADFKRGDYISKKELAEDNKFSFNVLDIK